MCLAYFQGKGYSGEFTAHMGKMKRWLEQNPVIRVSAETDIICKACPNNREGVCETAAKVAGYDRQVLSRCGLSEGSELPYSEFQKLVRERILIPGKREEICGDCQWNDLCR